MLWCPKANKRVVVHCFCASATTHADPSTVTLCCAVLCSAVQCSTEAAGTEQARA